MYGQSGEIAYFGTRVPNFSRIYLYINRFANSEILKWKILKIRVTFGVLILGIFEGFVHNMGIFLFQLKGVSPGWYTAVLMAAYAIWAIVLINRNIDYPGIQWLWGILWFLLGFMCLEISVHYLMGSTPKKSLGQAKLFLKDRFGKDETLL